MLPYRLRNRLSGAQVRRVTIPDPNPGDGARP
jgi:hypothetical protein